MSKQAIYKADTILPYISRVPNAEDLLILRGTHPEKVGDNLRQQKVHLIPKPFKTRLSTAVV